MRTLGTGDPIGGATVGPLERARAAYERAAWPEAHRLFADAARDRALGADDLWRYAMAAYLVGHDDAFLASLDAAHEAFLVEGDAAKAARCAFWLGFRLTDLGEAARGSGWLARAHRLLERVDEPCVERGYVLLPRAQAGLAAGANDQAFEAASEALAIGEAFDDADLQALALQALGLARLRQARLAEGLAFLDEAVVGVSRERTSPLVTGIVFCAVIAACRSVHALDRANAWTEALDVWCERQPGLVPYAGQCMVHRAEILRLRGSWDEALAEARRAEERCRAAGDRAGTGAALYAQAEALRSQGRTDEAERAYAAASASGRDPQPGLALLRARNGRHAAAAASLRRALQERPGPTARVRLLPALVEVLLASGNVEGAREVLADLERVASRLPTDSLATIALRWRGACDLADGKAADALASLRTALRGWQRLNAPYETARTRELVAAACDALGDGDTAGIERAAARATYLALGAGPDLSRLDRAGRHRHGLTPREIEVLRLVAAGRSNKDVAASLGISVRTVERHLSNIFGKIGVASRAAATAFAYEHGLA